ncbi:hypothetical protein [Pararobbsia alpina]|uniref:Uncharacterized protein n=1 Tax=Pararobbsia alpina TaxID=621374 RepID=A0A6S7CA51_9BURK|nr:hypothetical protein [Pararobbsia alpina]CAB3784660.1 hypothetical protein LMG28138_01853 [Pararobbsia alpina]
MSAELSFSRMCEILPPEFSWGDALTPDVMKHITGALLATRASDAAPAAVDGATRGVTDQMIDAALRSIRASESAIRDSESRSMMKKAIEGALEASVVKHPLTPEQSHSMPGDASPSQHAAVGATRMAHLEKALVYVAHHLHAEPQYHLCEGVMLIDHDGVRVKIEGVDVEVGPWVAPLPRASEAVKESLTAENFASDAPATAAHAGATIAPGAHLWHPADIPAITEIPADFLQGDRKAYAFKNPGAGEHDPWYVVLPRGESLKLGYHADDAIDKAHAVFIASAINAALAAAPTSVADSGATLTDGPRLPAMPEHVLSDIQAATKYMEMWAKGEAFYAPKNGYDEPGIKTATITDVKKTAAYIAPRLRASSIALQDYFAEIDLLAAAKPVSVDELSALMERYRIAVTPEHEASLWHADLYGDVSEEPIAYGQGSTPIEAARAALAATGDKS